ncbi:MAG: ABC transporter ATP-binding protein [Clostridia bacterium]|nr:ABC transporter ATP-binding protein [Clostridia bacterium]
MEMVRPHLKVFILCLALVLVITALDIFRPVVIGDAIDRYITGDFLPGEQAEMRLRGIGRAALIYVLLLAALLVCNRFEHLIMQRLGQDIVYDLRNRLFAHMESLSMRFFDTTPVGKIVTRITNDVEAIHGVFSTILVNLFQNSVKIAGYILVMFILNPRMALYSIIMVPVAAVLTLIFRTLSKRAFRVTRTKVTALNTFLSEHIGGMRIIQIFAREKEKHGQFREKSDELFKASYREMMVNALFRPATYLISVAALALVILIGGFEVQEGVASFGTLYIFLQYINNLFYPIQDLAEQFATLQSAVASAEKIFTLLDEGPTVIQKPDAKVLSGPMGSIEFDHVWFAYQGEDYVLKDLSFTIGKGERVAFVGATGAGKSSILNLIGRYYDIQKGRILIDGTDIRDLDITSLRSRIGQVQQEVFIFTGDIASNIRLRDEEIGDERITAAAEMTNADRFIRRLPGRYHERVTERGSTFSAGERQLISFARTLVRDPDVLILDEATANIDTQTEEWIQDALEKLMRGRTTIMVAHRLSTIQHADKIIVMHHGRIREQGTHQKLLEKDGIYRKLYLLQLD